MHTSISELRLTSVQSEHICVNITLNGFNMPLVQANMIVMLSLSPPVFWTRGKGILCKLHLYCVAAAGWGDVRDVRA